MRQDTSQPSDYQESEETGDSLQPTCVPKIAHRDDDRLHICVNLDQ